MGVGYLGVIDPAERLASDHHRSNDCDGKYSNSDAEQQGLTHGRPVSPLRIKVPAERIEGTQMPTNTPCISWPENQSETDSTRDTKLARRKRSFARISGLARTRRSTARLSGDTEDSVTA